MYHNEVFVMQFPDNIPEFTKEEEEIVNQSLYMYDSATNEEEIHESIWNLNCKLLDFTKLYFIMSLFNRNSLTGDFI
jgi:hypothetical protein